MSEIRKPPIGVMPETFWKEERLKALDDAEHKREIRETSKKLKK